jgi:predicted Zn-dependent protease
VRAAGNDEADDGEPQALSLIKSVPGNVSLESMLTEIAKLDAVHAAGLPDAAKASSQRPQATLVTQPKITTPCEDGPGDTAERPFGFGRDGQPADPGVTPDRRECARRCRRR